ncbi:LOW QUALITY PROTEIN: hypothetical protein CRUP_029297 [Coryphaenoides rupestris]|nr:LOW QUALITY PROTEIN: hypothetical protein CRUP_029297 [Coryphaenoides rupestris]
MMHQPLEMKEDTWNPWGDVSPAHEERYLFQETNGHFVAGKTRSPAPRPPRLWCRSAASALLAPRRRASLEERCNRILRNMEGSLTARDRVGVQDLVLLDAHTSESAFLDNLRKRFHENLVYTYIGTLLVSVNPYKDLDIYSKKHMDTYMGVNFFELPPHIYALADNVFRTMLSEFNNHFILISGESGAGKTETSKKILQFYAVSCPSTKLLDNVRDRLLLSNPVLEAFGNAKTLKNDNSSRFGKYMDIQFDHQGGDEELLRWLGLERNCQKYSYLVQGDCAKVTSINDKRDWKTVRNALSVIEFSEKDAEVLQQGLTHRKIEAKMEEVYSPFAAEHAVYARDALAKAIYGRTFTWLVNKINESLANKDSSRKTVIGLLDIYGFEVFHVNSFEQFCINYCNEKLQQLFIQLTLKSEQEEYHMEGIEWEPVPYFNNKIICDLVEEKHRGIISILDEECLRPGEATDLTFLEKLEEKIQGHPHFVTHKLADQKTRKTLQRGDFRLLHYAGEVTYCVVGFLDKNNDLLYRNVKEVMRQSQNAIIKHCFPRTEPDSKKRPETVVTQFKSSLVGLAGRFDDVLVRHQVKYLGLMEHLRVRRAGFAYRRKYEIFLERTKIFIRHPRTLFATEDAFEVCKHELATRIQAKYKGYRAKGDYKKQREAATKIETCWRGLMARKEREKRAWAVKVIKRFIKGFMTRNQPACNDNTEYLAFVRHSYLSRLRDNLPRSVVDRSAWPTPPPIMQEASKLLQSLYIRHMVRKYLQCKALTSSMFRGRKDNYPSSVARPFLDTRISEGDISLRVLQTIRHEVIKYGVPVVKYDRNGFRPRVRQLLLTQTAVYLVEEAKVKQRIHYNALKVKHKGDVILQCDHLFEALTKLSVIANKQNSINVVQGSVRFDIQPGREGFIEFKSGQEAMIYRSKNGRLMVESATTKSR